MWVEGLVVNPQNLSFCLLRIQITSICHYAHCHSMDSERLNSCFCVCTAKPYLVILPSSPFIQFSFLYLLNELYHLSKKKKKGCLKLQERPRNILVNKSEQEYVSKDKKCTQRIYISSCIFCTSNLSTILKELQ